MSERSMTMNSNETASQVNPFKAEAEKLLAEIKARKTNPAATPGRHSPEFDAAVARHRARQGRSYFQAW